MDEEALGRRLPLVIPEQADLVAHRGRAEPRDAQARRDEIGKGHLAEIAAAGLDHEPDLPAIMDVEHAVLHEPTVHGGVEQRIVHDIVHVAVDVVVHPAGRDRPEGLVGGAGGRRGALCHHHAAR